MFMDSGLNWDVYDTRYGVSAKLREWAGATTPEAKAEILIGLNQDIQKYVQWGQKVTGERLFEGLPVGELAAKLRDFNDGTLSLDPSTLLILIGAKRKLEAKARELGDAYLSLSREIRRLDGQKDKLQLDERVVKALASVRDLQPRVGREHTQPKSKPRTRAHI